MKIIAGLSLLTLSVLSTISISKAEVLSHIAYVDIVETMACNTGVYDLFDNQIKHNNDLRYIGFSILVDPEEEGYCEITLNGTIETDIGTVTFENFKMRVKGDDCTELALKILNSFRED